MKNYRLTCGIILCGISLLWTGLKATEKERAFPWKLKGSEILLELEHRLGKMPHGVYAIDPFNPKSEPRLLIRGGERPVWSPKRNFFAYVKDQYLYIVRRDGGEEVNVAWSVPDGGYYFHDPTVYWSWQEGFALVERNTELGSVVHSPNPGPFKSLEGLRIGVLESPVLPLTRQAKNAKETKSPLFTWKEILTINNPTFSPDGKLLAAEVYPAAPMDVCRSKSHVMIFEYPDGREIPMGWYGGAHIFAGPPKRLTSLPEGVCELMPLWSPTGEWIAFTLCDLEKGYIAPAVVRPDGSQITLLLPKGMKTLWLAKEWFPLGVRSVQKAWLEGPPMGRASGWGFPHIFAVEWSPDGKYILLNQGRRYESLMVAKWQGGKWWGRGTWGMLPAVRFACWGVGEWFAYIPGRRPTKEDLIYVWNVETLKGINLIAGSHAVIRWMDW